MEQCADTARVFHRTLRACAIPTVISNPARPCSSVTPFGYGCSLPCSHLIPIISDRDRNYVPDRLIYRVQMHLC